MRWTVFALATGCAAVGAPSRARTIEPAAEANEPAPSRATAAASSTPAPLPGAPPAPPVVSDGCVEALKVLDTRPLLSIHFADLPAVSDDGATVVVAFSSEDGARGNPNLTVEVIDAATSARLAKTEVVDDDDPFAPGVHERVALARQSFAHLRLLPMTAYQTTEDRLAPIRQQGVGEARRASVARGEGLAVHFIEPDLIVTRPRVRVLLREPRQQWRGALLQHASHCPRPLAALDIVYGRAELGTFVAAIDYYGGSDACWEPDTTWHAFRVPALVGGG
jgi:hypothetical protein